MMWLICILSQSQRQQLVVALESSKWFWNSFQPLQSLNFLQWYLLVTHSVNQGSECVEGAADFGHAVAWEVTVTNDVCVQLQEGFVVMCINVVWM